MVQDNVSAAAGRMLAEITRLSETISVTVTASREVSGEDTYQDSVMGCVGGRLHLVCTATVAMGVRIPSRMSAAEPTDER